MIKVLKGKRGVSRLIRAVTLMKRNQKTVLQRAELYTSATFLSLTSPKPSFSYSLQLNQPQPKNTSQCQIPNIIQCVHFTTQKWRFPKFWKPQKDFFFILPSELKLARF
jgi:hypothetical protein